MTKCVLKWPGGKWAIAGWIAEQLPKTPICGGFPCQDLSIAGKRVGISGARSGLWSQFVRVVRVLRPPVVPQQACLAFLTLAARAGLGGS